MAGGEGDGVDVLVLGILERFVGVESDKLGHAIDVTLEEVARFAGADMAHTLELSPEGDTFSMTHVWRAPSFPEVPNMVVDVTIDQMAPPLRSGALLVVDDVETLPDDVPFKASVKRYGIGALLEAPLVVAGELQGTFGLSRIGEAHPWSEAEQRVLRFAASAIVHATQRSRSEQERRELERRLAQSARLEAIGQLAAGIAHDFNNMLVVIRSFSRIAQSRGGDDEVLAEAFSAIDGAVDRSAELTRKLMAFGSRLPSEQRRVDPAALVRGITSLLRRLVPSNIELDVRAPEDVRPIRADAGQIEQVLVNLCVNARDSMPEGGRMELEVADVDVAEGQEPDLSGGPHVLIRVSDTGHGFDASIEERLFEPFFTTKEPGQGTGLGLAMVRGLIKGHGGVIRVESDLGVGTTFRIFLPASDGEVDEEPRVVRPLPKPIRRGRILVADDDRAVVQAVTRALELGGHQVEVAASGLDAVEMVRADPDRFDLALLDVMMPKLTGPEAADAIRTIRRDLPVVLSTGYAGPTIQRTVSERQYTMLRKPYEVLDLLELVAELLGDPDQRR